VNLPTDNHVVPSRGDVMLMGSGEGAAPAPMRAAAVNAAPAATPVSSSAVEAAPIASAQTAPVRESAVQPSPIASSTPASGAN
jgi:pilus assembly protein CpaC